MATSARFSAIAAVLILASACVERPVPPGTGSSSQAVTAPGTASRHTLLIAVEFDRGAARLLRYSLKDRPFIAEPPAAARALAAGDREVQLEITLSDGRGGALVRRVEVGPVCLDHDAGDPPHVEGDTIFVHRDSTVIELPALPGHDRVEIAIHRAAQANKGGPIPPISRIVLGRERLDRPRFDPAGGPAAGSLGMGALPFAPDDGAPPPEEGEAAAPSVGLVHWPEEYDDPDIYRVYGDPAASAERINITIVPDGYTYGEKALMEQHAQSLVNYFRQKSPYAEHDPFLNYTLVYAYSTESGTDQCDCDIIADTAMATRFPNATPTCGSSDNRCLFYGGGCDTNTSGNLSAAEMRAPYRDKTIVMVNTTRYGGCGGTRAVYAAGNGSALEIAGHEMGHSLGGLADEYTSYSSCGSSAGNINTSLDAQNGAWPEWIGTIGAPRQGAQYYTQCIYRPRDNCAMRALNQPFCEVCKQRYSLVFFGHARVAPTAPVRSTSPATGQPVMAVAGAPVSFAVSTRFAAGAGVTNSITWRLTGPGQPTPGLIAQGVTQINHSFAQVGQYTLTCEVIADTNFIKPSKNGANAETVTWTVNVEAGGCANDGQCADGNPCNGVETCVNGQCAAGTPVTCAALDACHVAGTCDPATGLCSNPAGPDGTQCNDGDLCTINDVCANAACGGTPVQCDDGARCTADSCDAGTGQCVHAPVPGCGCGDGVLDPGEECDDGNRAAGDACNANCRVEYLLGIKASATLSGTAFTTRDILSYDPEARVYRMYFKGADNGAPSTTWSGFHRLPDGVGSSRVDLQACKLEYSIVSPK